MAQSMQPRVAPQTIEAFVGEALDNARLGPIHWRVLALVAGGYFFDVLDFTIFGALVPDLLKSGFVSSAQTPWVGSATALGLFVGTLGQDEFTDRFGRKAIYQFNLLLFGLATIGAALAPNFLWLVVGRFLGTRSSGSRSPSRAPAPS
jgi:putative MFS transporter